MSLLQEIFPTPCPLCGAPLPQRWIGAPVPLCPSCVASLRTIGGDSCPSCGKPLISELGRCLRCREREYAFERNLGAFLYAGTARDMIQAYKFAGVKELSGPISRAMSARLDDDGELSSWKMGGFVLVPVPSTRRKRRERGWEPVKRIVSELLREGRRGGGSPRSADILSRESGQEQKGLDFKGRLENIKGKIRLRRPPVRREGLSGIILVDDVFTTGATLSECARILKEGGFERVFGVTAAVDA